MSEFISYEPLTKNRWIININNMDNQIFKSFNIITEDNDLKLIINTRYFIPMGIINPITYYNTKNVSIDFVDPTGVVVDTMKIKCVFDGYSMSCDYGDGSILGSEIKFKITDIITKSEIDRDKIVLENYLKNKQPDLEQQK